MSKNRRVGWIGRPLEGDALDQKGFEEREVEAVWRKGAEKRAAYQRDAELYRERCQDIKIDIIAMDHFFGRRGIEEDRQGNYELAELCREVVHWTRQVRDRQPLPNTQHDKQEQESDT